MLHTLRNSKGLGLVEILAAITLSGILAGAIYSVYILHNRSFSIQNEVAEMQQNMRAGMFMMEREIRMAGYDPTGNANARIVTATPTLIEFTADLDGDGNTNGSDEHVTYSLYDDGSDGINDLGRDTGSGYDAVAENVDALDFVYLDASSTQLDDGSGSVTTNISSIRAVQVSLVARTGKEDPDITNGTAYKNQQGATIYTAPDDRYRRKLLSTQMKCRNMGL